MKHLPIGLVSLVVRNADEINHQRLRWDFVRRQGRKIEHSGLCEVFLTQVEDADSSVIRVKDQARM